MSTSATDLSYAVVGAIVLAWKLWQLPRRPRDRGLWLITGCIAVAEIEYLLPLPAVAAALDHTLGAGTTRLGQNLTLLWFTLLLVCFFRYSTGQAARIRGEVLACVVASGVLIVVAATIPGPLRATSYSAHLPAVQLRVFYLISYGYLGYILLAGLRPAWTFARLSRPPLSMGLRIIAIALGGKLIGGPVVRIPTNVADWVGHPLPTWLVDAGAVLVQVSIIAFLAGVVYPLAGARVLAVARWWRNRRAHRGLGPLWTELHRAFPHDELDREPGRRWWRRSMRHRFYRRAVECRDGLVRLSPHWPRDDSSSDGTSRDGTSRHTAEQLRTALRAHADRRPPLGPAMLVAAPTRPGVDADVAALLALSRGTASLDND
ncbi:MAG: hypothetical protein M3Z25_08255 [Actinomycetota bacterium]|nr:hypothetical protein [Actinomycetota bacterium]